MKKLSIRIRHFFNRGRTLKKTFSSTESFENSRVSISETEDSEIFDHSDLCVSRDLSRNRTENISIEEVLEKSIKPDNDCHSEVEQNIQKELIGEKYEIIKWLGNGSMGKVYLSRDIKNLEDVALKRIPSPFLQKSENSILDESKDSNSVLYETSKVYNNRKMWQIRKEIEILMNTKHKNIVDFFCSIEDNTFIYIAMEYLAGGELFDYVREEERLDEYETAFILRQIFSAVTYLHSINIIHRDLKLENVILVEKKKFPHVKIIDFGLSKTIDTKILKRHSSCGSPEYLSPEVILNQPYGFKSDMWSLGVMFYCIITGYMPFYGTSYYQVRSLITNAEYSWDNDTGDISVECKEFVGAFIRTDFNSRPSAEESLKNEWLMKSCLKAENVIKKL